ncbi:SigE family RNA polymerase sigma factor [Streptacidiphilus jiangxiensis]|uniref:RNA polymerase sigma-70 factor, sigma-E family n=1 Tax=Streptacidiphilus jiangxiensis TaxID=235985 RepID=A0A1H7FL72_STRJI|nr:SigE family RNA polymerase sigma factor [Streptacidiphilus jiangxiensis]SEK26729.1 RNA polymerase sigma-70 factor, sigma-E family [Streptacidiphilus jiangxiensis]
MHTANQLDFHDFAASRWPRLFRLALLLTDDQGLAEDLAQSALTAVYASWSRVRRADDPDAYARRILLNAHLGRFRRKRPMEVPLVAEAGPSVPDPAGAVDTRLALNAALASLPPRQRAVVVLRYWADLTEEQTAASLGCSVGTVKSQASKAMAKLRVHPALAHAPEEVHNR